MTLDISLALTVLTSAFTLAGYIFYDQNIYHGTCRPNIASWVLWTLTYLLILMSYFSMTGDPLKVSLQFVSVFACMVTLSFVLHRGSFQQLTSAEKTTLAFGIVSAFMWWIFRSATTANMILQFALIAAFIPTYISVWKGPKSEGVIPWIFWTLAYISLVTTVLIRWEGTIAELVGPIVGLLLNLGITLIIMLKRV